MATFTIEVQDLEVRSVLNQLADKADDMQPILEGIGRGIVSRTKERFGTSTGPDGVKWKDNADATLGVLRSGLGKGYRRKNGSLNAAGERRIAGKKPLIGESGDLRRQIVAIASNTEVVVNASTAYAAIHQFGGKAGRGLKVTIPARPFLPITQSGDLYPEEKVLILQAVNDYLLDF